MQYTRSIKPRRDRKRGIKVTQIKTVSKRNCWCFYIPAEKPEESELEVLKADEPFVIDADESEVSNA